jgi:hypothetical protein
MLTKGNSGRYLTEEYRRLLELGIKDRDLLSAEELAWVDKLPADMGYGKEDDETFKIQSQPVDMHTEATKTLDYRARNECGDKEE